ncbi:MAG: TlpA family protein disulfide reductase [Gemmatimonadetes bacterium]|nr:TlpA family protein disulfide reductase [Gemmatimonadota bacterium]
MRRPGSPILALALALALAPALLGCEGAGGAEAGVGEPVPEYGALSLVGDSVSLAELRGSAVLLNVWATWCPPCRREMPELQALHERNATRGLRVVGVSIDARGADDLVEDFLDEYGITYAIWRDPDERVASAFAIQGVPATILIDRAGIVRWRRLGPISAEDPALVEALEEVLQGSGIRDQGSGDEP